MTLSGPSTYTGATSISAGTLIAGGNVAQRQPRRLRHRRQCAVDRRQQLRRQCRRADDQRSLHDRPSDHGQRHGRPPTLGTISSSGTSTFSGALTLNGSNTVTLSTPAGGTALFSGNITGTGTGTLDGPRAQQHRLQRFGLVRGANPRQRRDPDAQQRHARRQRGHHRQQRTPVPEQRHDQQQRHDHRERCRHARRQVTEAISSRRVNASVASTAPSPLSDRSPLNFTGGNNLTMNAGSTFVMQANNQVASVSITGTGTFSYDANNGIVNLMAFPLDGGATLNGDPNNGYTFLSWRATVRQRRAAQLDCRRAGPSSGPAPATRSVGATPTIGAA